MNASQNSRQSLHPPTPTVERWLAEQAIRSPIAGIDQLLVIVRWSIILLAGGPFLLDQFHRGVRVEPVTALLGIVLFNLILSWYVLRRRPLASGHARGLLLADFAQLYLIIAFTGGYQSLFFTFCLLLMAEIALSTRWHVALMGIIIVGILAVATEWALGIPANEPLATYIVTGKFTISLLIGLLTIMLSELTRREDTLRQETTLAAARVAQLNHLLMRLGESKFDLHRALVAILESVHAVPNAVYSLVLMRTEGAEGWDVAASTTALHPVGEHLASLPTDGTATAYFTSGAGTTLALPAFAADDPIQRLSGVYLRTPDNELLGILLLGRPGSQALSLFDRAYLQSLAVEAGLALRNARIYAQERQHSLALQQFQQAQSTYFSAMSHELKTPLAVLKMLVPALEHEKEMSVETRQEVYETLNQNLQRLENMINDLLESAKLEAGAIRLHTDMVDISKLVRRTLATLEPLLASKKQEVVVEMAAAPLWAWADSRRAEEVLVNLVSNASKFSPAASKFQIKISSANDQILICVQDTGPGIPDDQKERVFDRFYSTSEDLALAGVGLGLFIARKLVELHGGRIWVEDGEMGGSCFYFTFPQAQTEVSHNAEID